MFEQLVTDVLKEGTKLDLTEEPKEMVHLLTDPTIYHDLYRDKLSDTDNMNEQDLFDLLYQCLPCILDNVYNGNLNDAIYFKNARVLKAVANIASRVRLTLTQITTINRIVYMYKTAPAPDEFILTLMNSLQKIVNKYYIRDIVSLTGISEQQALDITVALLCGEHSLENVIRMNNQIVQLSKDYCTEQNVIYIYETFSDVLKMSYLLQSVMVSQFQQKFGPKYDNNFSIITFAVLKIINDHSVIDIRNTLIKYLDIYKDKQYRPRISLRGLAGNYPRLQYMINELLYEGMAIY